MKSRQIIDQYKRPLRDLRVSVTDRCNFRCPYCMPAEIYGEKYEFLPKSVGSRGRNCSVTLESLPVILSTNVILPSPQQALGFFLVHVRFCQFFLQHSCGYLHLRSLLCQGNGWGRNHGDFPLVSIADDHRTIGCFALAPTRGPGGPGRLPQVVTLDLYRRRGSGFGSPLHG